MARVQEIEAWEAHKQDAFPTLRQKDGERMDDMERHGN